MQPRLSRISLITLIALVQFVLQPLGANAWCMLREAAGHACCCVESVEELRSCCSSESATEQTSSSAPSQQTCECSAAAEQPPATTPELPEWCEALPIAAFAYEQSPPLVLHSRALAREREYPPRPGRRPRALLQVFLL